MTIVAIINMVFCLSLVFGGFLAAIFRLMMISKKTDSQED